ncbi:MAG TPA: hypothetical protein VML01_03935 [Bryobacterales bacterium]|nr:hypothetical protein [Bryobacterales bacterium]
MADSHTQKVEKRAMRAAKSHFENEGYSVQDVTRVRGHNGYDLIIARGAESAKVEVKGCSREWDIPDFYSTEFDSDRRLVADLLCVVYLLSAEADPRICVLPRDAIPTNVVVPKFGFRIQSGFKKRHVLEKYCTCELAPPTRDA